MNRSDGRVERITGVPRHACPGRAILTGMRVFVGVTDNDWFAFLAARPDIADLNVWRPSGQPFTALAEGAPCLIKLHAPLQFIVGGGFFARSLALPLTPAWDTFGPGNGPPTCEARARRVARSRRGPSDPLANPVIPCIILSGPFVLPQERRLAVTAGFSSTIGVGTGYAYAAQDPDGRALLDAVTAQRVPVPTSASAAAQLGQGAFHAVVTVASGRRCSVTGEKTLPVLEAAHVQPSASGGPHAGDHGLLRSNLHRRFDLGYVTVDPDDRRVLVSRRIRDEVENGRPSCALEGQALREPVPGCGPVSTERRRGQAEQVFRG